MPRQYNLRSKASTTPADIPKKKLVFSDNKEYVNYCKTVICNLNTQINQKEAELKAFIEQKSREIGLTQLKEQHKNIDKQLKEECLHFDLLHSLHPTSLGFEEFESRYHCRDCNKRWSE
jgi:hypothetical protein